MLVKLTAGGNPHGQGKYARAIFESSAVDSHRSEISVLKRTFHCIVVFGCVVVFPWSMSWFGTIIFSDTSSLISRRYGGSKKRLAAKLLRYLKT